ncbi:hypothetical protein BJ138DRAFT_1106694 [Hygrophoropsis aurantiaca]|uniref:Uncharacterized protein n=1 Tax=Hygrophoropsis aurantiaca TaxID=72124 RepID=A0ACB7ZUH0_9AGAM|nr:hypothetical protein BJ138DRAFT_1106694 [Hygrophoropsis aurantiaca]
MVNASKLAFTEVRMSNSMHFVNSGDYLSTLVSAMRRNADIRGRIKALHVSFRFSEPSVKQLQSLLRMASNLEDLSLRIPEYSRARWGRLFQHLRLRRLELFQASAPHFFLANFLNHHPTIKYLTLESCQTTIDACGMATVSLPQLEELSAPMACAVELIGGIHLNRVKVTSQSERDEAVPITTFFAAISHPMTPLTSLSMDFNSFDYNLLWRIARAAPLLSALKLQEKPPRLSVRGVRWRRAWNNARQWSKDLASLSRLKHFDLATYAPVVKQAGNEEKELAVVCGWVPESGAHMLNNITLLYGKGSKSSTLSFFVRREGRWLKTTTDNSFNIHNSDDDSSDSDSSDIAEMTDL